MRRALRVVVSIGGVSIITLVAHRVIPVNATTVGFAYLLFVLVVASVWGFLEASLCSILATLLFNFYFLPPVGTFTIADPQNWIALFSFLATALIASRLSAEVKRRALDAVERQQDVERLYSFSRAILLIEDGEPFPKQLAQKLAEIFALDSVELYDRRSDEIYPLEAPGAGAGSGGGRSRPSAQRLSGASRDQAALRRARADSGVHYAACEHSRHDGNCSHDCGEVPRRADRRLRQPAPSFA